MAGGSAHFGPRPRRRLAHRGGHRNLPWPTTGGDEPGALNEEGRLVGLLSLSDIARHADEEYARGAANRYVTDAEIARLAADISKRRRD
jgi:hypothetical protein